MEDRVMNSQRAKQVGTVVQVVQRRVAVGTEKLTSRRRRAQGDRRRQCPVAGGVRRQRL